MQQMIRARILILSGWIWVSLASLVLVISILGAFAANGFWGGLRQIQEWFSPYNLANFIVLVLTFGPGLALISWGKKLRSKVQPVS